jgi:FtsP/CotA-like multicopper oxidase with cupredoxin domain
VDLSLVFCVEVCLYHLVVNLRARADKHPVHQGPGFYKAVWELNEWVVDFKRPTLDNDTTPITRKTPYQMNGSPNIANKFLVNGLYPGPTVDVFEGDQVEITVVNHLGSAATTIHWHGQGQRGTPFMDGTRSVSQAGILPGQNFTYRFTAGPAGTQYWHGHMDTVQSAKGIKGPLIVRPPPEREPFQYAEGTSYDVDQVVVISDEWQEPDVCLRLEGAIVWV